MKIREKELEIPREQTDWERTCCFGIKNGQ